MTTYQSKGINLKSIMTDGFGDTVPVLDLSDNGGIFCGYVDGTVPTMVDCARAGCYLCRDELDISCDDSWMEDN